MSLNSDIRMIQLCSKPPAVWSVFANLNETDVRIFFPCDGISFAIFRIHATTISKAYKLAGLYGPGVSEIAIDAVAIRDDH